MRTSITVIRRFLFLGCFSLVPGQLMATALDHPIKVSVNPNKTHQTIDGFGASDAWRCQFVGRNWPLAKREQIADLLFSQATNQTGQPLGIGLSLWRFNLGAGTTEQGNASGIQNPWRRAECFQNPDGSYDWSKLQGQRWFLNAARKRGTERFLAFVNAPPVHLSNNGKGYATKGDLHLNVSPGKLRDYARYLVDVIEHFSKAGTPFAYLSPVNEPQWEWDGTGQEGSPALNEEIYALVRYLSHDLFDRQLTTHIVIGEAGTIGHAAIAMDSVGMTSDGRDNQAQFFFSPDSPFKIWCLPNVENTISAHSYHSVWPVDKQVTYRQQVYAALQAANPDLGYWMSEYCILQRNDEIRSGGRRDLGMNTALYVARVIHHDLTLTNARSWQWWTAITQCDFKDGLVYLDDGSRGDNGRMGPETGSLRHDGVVRESKLLWALGNYSRFIRPGAVRVSCQIEPGQSATDGVLASAYRTPQDQTVVVLTNLSPEEQVCDLGYAANATVYTTDQTHNLSPSHQSSDSIFLPPRSVATVCPE